MKNINEQQWQKLVSETPDSVLIDVRSKEEFATGFLENAENLPINETEKFLSKIQQMDKTKSYFIYCLAGSRSATACQLMDSYGFEKTYNLSEGISSWTGKKVKYDQ